MKVTTATGARLSRHLSPPSATRPGRLLLAGSLLHLALRLVIGLGRDGPVIVADEIGYLANARVMSGGDLRLQADHVVVASGAHQRPRIPAFAAELDPAILQLDPNRYQDPSQLPGGGVLVVGAGNSGAEIAFEVSRTHPTWLSGPDTGHIPVRTGSRWDRLLTPLSWWFVSRVLTVQTPIGRKVRPKALTTTSPLERVRPKELASAGVERVPRTVGVRDGLPLLEDGRVMDVATVLWCTGFRPDFSFIDLPVFGQDGAPMHQRGVVGSQPGLYFLGLWFLSAFTSSLLGGVGSDAEHIAEQIASRQPDGRPAEVLTSARRTSQLE
jgi:putative flavoprotein involved in K+ transport